MDFFSLLDFESFVRLMGPALESRIGGDVIVLGFVWFLMRKKVANHFSMIELSLEKIGSNIQDLKESIMDLEKTQTKKINDLGERVTRLEINKQ